jgi:hypothetical protein
MAPNSGTSGKEIQALKIADEQIDATLDEFNIKDDDLKILLKEYCRQAVKASKREFSVAKLKEISAAYLDGFRAHEDRIIKSAPEIRKAVLKMEQSQKLARLLDDLENK